MPGKYCSRHISCPLPRLPLSRRGPDGSPRPASWYGQQLVIRALIRLTALPPKSYVRDVPKPSPFCLGISERPLALVVSFLPWYCRAICQAVNQTEEVGVAVSGNAGGTLGHEVIGLSGRVATELREHIGPWQPRRTARPGYDRNPQNQSLSSSDRQTPDGFSYRC